MNTRSFLTPAAGGYYVSGSSMAQTPMRFSGENSATGRDGLTKAGPAAYYDVPDWNLGFGNPAYAQGPPLHWTSLRFGSGAWAQMTGQFTAPPGDPILPSQDNVPMTALQPLVSDTWTGTCPGGMVPSPNGNTCVKPAAWFVGNDTKSFASAVANAAYTGTIMPTMRSAPF